MFQYACNVFPPCKNEIRHIDRIIYRVIAKVFKTYDVQIIENIKLHFDIVDFKNYCVGSFDKFVHKFQNKSLCYRDIIISMNKHLSFI